MNIQSSLIVAFSKFHSLILRLTGGKFMGRLAGLDMLLLTTVGRKTGKKRYTTLLFKKIDGHYYCAGSFGGSHKAPQWYRNILSNPNVGILAEGKYMNVTAVVLEDDLKAIAWESLIDIYPNFQKYQNKTDRVIPVIKFQSSPNRD